MEAGLAAALLDEAGARWKRWAKPSATMNVGVDTCLALLAGLGVFSVGSSSGICHLGVLFGLLGLVNGERLIY